MGALSLRCSGAVAASPATPAPPQPSRVNQASFFRRRRAVTRGSDKAAVARDNRSRITSPQRWRWHWDARASARAAQAARPWQTADSATTQQRFHSTLVSSARCKAWPRFASAGSPRAPAGHGALSHRCARCPANAGSEAASWRPGKGPWPMASLGFQWSKQKSRSGAAQPPSRPTASGDARRRPGSVDAGSRSAQHGTGHGNPQGIGVRAP